MNYKTNKDKFKALYTQKLYTAVDLKQVDYHKEYANKILEVFDKGLYDTQGTFFKQTLKECGLESNITPTSLTRWFAKETT